MRPKSPSCDWPAIARDLAAKGHDAEYIADELAERMEPDYCDEDGGLSAISEEQKNAYAEELADQAVFDAKKARDIAESDEQDYAAWRRS